MRETVINYYFILEEHWHSYRLKFSTIQNLFLLYISTQFNTRQLALESEHMDSKPTSSIYCVSWATSNLSLSFIICIMEIIGLLQRYSEIRYVKCYQLGKFSIHGSYYKYNKTLIIIAIIFEEQLLIFTTYFVILC